MSKIAVIGSDGQLGSEIKAISSEYPQHHFTFINRSVLDLSSEESIANYFFDKKFDCLINCAAYTAVDLAESEKDKAEMINHRAVASLAKVSLEKNMSFIHLSTDYVFDGKNSKAYEENGTLDPVNFYGKTKAMGERAIMEIAPSNSIIIRTSWMYSPYGNNFVKTMLRLGHERASLGVVDDQLGSPTYAFDLARVILEILPKIKTTGPVIYHYSNEGEISWCDFAKEIQDLAKTNCVVNAITTDQYPTKAKRPQYSVLSKEKIKKDFGITIPFWKDSLKACLNRMNGV